jgi:dTDP-4-dehydrorhamnose 3,5-epimerase
VLDGAKKDSQKNTAEWQMVRAPIDGVVVHEVRHVPGNHSITTEIFRPEWDPTGLPVAAIHQTRIFPGTLAAWSCHLKTVDRLFVSQGLLKIVLYDDRGGSPTRGNLMELHLGDPRPALLVLPEAVWHGIENVGIGEALLLNLTSEPYDYGDPDHYRLPSDSDQIPYSWRR